LASPVEIAGDGTREHFDFELKKKFDQYDKDKDGL
jgi:hypothetical protein